VRADRPQLKWRKCHIPQPPCRRKIDANIKGVQEQQLKLKDDILALQRKYFGEGTAAAGDGSSGSSGSGPTPTAGRGGKKSNR
jgi:hypothetical protein